MTSHCVFFIVGIGSGMAGLASVTATLRQFRGKFVATLMSGLLTSVNSGPLFLTLIYDVFFFRDGSYESQNIQGYFLCLSFATILCYAMAVVVFGLPTVGESDYIPIPDTEDARVANERAMNLSGTAERKGVMEDNITPGNLDEPVKLTSNCSAVQMLKSPRYAPLVSGSAVLMCLKYISLHNLNVMLASFGLSRYEASLPFLAHVSGVILRPIFGIFADWTRPYFSYIWYLYLAASVHLLCFVISIYNADNIYALSACLIMWPFASDTANVIQPAVFADDFGSGFFSVNLGILLSIFAVLAYAIQSVAGLVYESHVPEGSTNCFGLICFRETFGMGIGASLLSLGLITLYFYFWCKSTQWYI